MLAGTRPGVAAAALPAGFQISHNAPPAAATKTTVNHQVPVATTDEDAMAMVPTTVLVDRIAGTCRERWVVTSDLRWVGFLASVEKSMLS